MKETYEKYMVGSNPVKFFVEKAIVIGDADDKIPKDKMYDSYLFFCHAKKITPQSEHSFSVKLTKDFGFQAKQFRKDGKHVWCWIGVKLVDWRATEDSEQQTLPEFTEREKQEMR